MDRKEIAMPQARTASIPSSPPDLVPARMINEVLYCERLSYLEWAQSEFEDNAFTVEGRVVHRRADQPGGELPPLDDAAAPAAKAPSKKKEPDDEDDDEPAPEPRPYQARSVWLSSERLGITAKIDIVECYRSRCMMGDEPGPAMPIAS
jgi:CRISPR-associated protein Cas1